MTTSTLVSLLRDGVAEHPDARLLKCGGPWQSYADIDRLSDVMGGVLAGVGVGPGDRVATLATNRLELAVVLFACGKLGAVQVPLNPFLKGDFLRHQLTDSGALVVLADAGGCETVRGVLPGTSVKKVLCLDGEGDDRPLETLSYAELAAVAPPLPERRPAPGDLISIMYTSGTTGLPKGCMISHGYFLNSPRAWCSAGWLQEGDVLFTAMPLFHMGGQLVIPGALVAKASAVIEPDFSASRFMRRAAEEGATVLRGVGAMAAAILAQPPRPGEGDNTFRLAMFVPMGEDQQAAFEARFGVSVASAIYGQTECIPITITPVGTEHRPGTAGKPAPTIRVTLLDDDGSPVPAGAVGEVVVRPVAPHSIFSGYWNLPERSPDIENGEWHHTGDYAKFDEDGYLIFVDRKKDALRRRGENVSSIELENAIRQHPSVRQVAVVAVPSAMTEDEIKAFVVFNPDSVPSAAAFFDFLKDNLPYFAIPSYVAPIDVLPMTQTGKVQKHLLRDREDEGALWDFAELGLRVDKTERRAGAK